MSDSKSKIKSVTCAKCKQGFKFKRVPKMTSVVCPHCDAKIRFKRTKSESTLTKQSSVDADQQNSKPPVEVQRQIKPTKLPVPGIEVSKAESSDVDEPDFDEPELDAVEVPVIKTRRTRERVSFDGLQVDDANEAELDEPSFEAQDVTDQNEDGNLPNIKVDRRGKPKKLAGKKERGSSIDSPKIMTAPAVTSQSTLAVPKTVSIPGNESDLIDQSEGGEDQPVLAGHIDLLPPKFLVADIEADENVVVLPTATGGTQVVDSTAVTVSHGGKAVTLVALKPEELRRVRFIETLVALAIAGIMLAIALWLVL